MTNRPGHYATPRDQWIAEQEAKARGDFNYKSPWHGAPMAEDADPADYPDNDGDNKDDGFWLSAIGITGLVVCCVWLGWQFARAIGGL